MTKRTTKLTNESDALLREACRLVNLRDHLEDIGRTGSALHTMCVQELAIVRTKRDAL